MPRALTKKEYAEFLILQLGGSIIDVELENDIEKFLDMALIRIKPYMNTTKLATVPMSSCIDLTKLNVYTVTHVFRGNASSASSLLGTSSSNGSSSSSSSSSSSTTVDSNGNVIVGDQNSTSSGDISLVLSSDGHYSDDSYLFNPFFINYYGLMNGISSTTDSIAITMLTSQIVNTVTGGGSSDINFYQDGNNLYVDVDGGESEVTIQYLPDYQSVEEVDEPFWINYIMNMAMALTKIALGRARTKYNISNLPYELDGDTILSEGITELETLTQELRDNQEFWYFLD